MIESRLRGGLRACLFLATLARLASDVVRVFDPRGILGAGLDRRRESGA